MTMTYGAACTVILALLCVSSTAEQQCASGDGRCQNTQGFAMLQQKYRVEAMKQLVADDQDQEEAKDSHDEIADDDLREVGEDVEEETIDWGPEASLSLAEEGNSEEEDANQILAGPNGAVPGHANLEYVISKHWSRHGACCDGKSQKVLQLPTDRRGRWWAGNEEKCAAKAVELGFGTFSIARSGACHAVKASKCIVQLDHAKCKEYGSIDAAGYTIRDHTIPRVDSVYPHAGPIKGGQLVTVTGANLWAGPQKKNDMQEFTPPVTVCIQNVPCEIDYFNSTAEKVLCTTAEYNGSTEVPKDSLTDKSLENSLTLSGNLCHQLEKYVPGGYVFGKDKFIRTGHGFCNGIPFTHLPSASLEQCKAETLKRGGKAFMHRANRHKGRQPCQIYFSFCSQPDGRHHIFHVYSLIPPIPAVYVKHHGEFKGGLVNQKWNEKSDCYGDPFQCGYAYSDAAAAKVFDVTPSVATPGDKIKVVGQFFKTDLTDSMKVWLVPEENPSEPVFCKTMDSDGKTFKTTHTHSGSYFDCILPIGLVPGKYDVILVHPSFGESLPFTSFSVLARMESVHRFIDILTIEGAHLDKVKKIDIGSSGCSVQKSEFGILTCELSEKASYWDQDYYEGGAGVMIEKVTFNSELDPEDMPETFGDAVIEAARMGIEPEFYIASGLRPHKAVEQGDNLEAHFTRAKAFFKAPKTGMFLAYLQDHHRWGGSVFSMSGLSKEKHGPHNYPTGQLTMVSMHRSRPRAQVYLEAGVLYPVQLETMARQPDDRAHVDLFLMPHENHNDRIYFNNASFLTRMYDTPQVMAPNAMCADAKGCTLPHTSMNSAFLQTEVRSRPAAPERAQRARSKEIPMKELAALRQSAPGLGRVPRPAMIQITPPVPGSVTITEDGRSCHWGPETLFGDLKGCIPGDDCKKYENLTDAQKACSDYKGTECGGIAKIVQEDKKNTDPSYRDENTTYHYEIRTGRWLKSSLPTIAIQKLACGYWKQRADDVGRDPEKRACNLKDFQVEGEYGKDLATCQNYCMQASPRRPSGLISTRFVEYHNDTYCACFSKCEYSRHPDNFMSTADVYEMVSPDINSTENIPYLERYKNNPCLNKVCTFSKASTWGPSGVPSSKDTDIIYIPENVTLLLDQDVDIRYWVVEGTLMMDRKDLYIKAEGIFVNGGKLQVGTAAEPFINKLTFEMVGHWHSYRIPVFGSKVIGVTTGHLELYGKPIKKTWVELAETAQPESTTLKVLGQEAAEWEVGSKIVLAATDRVDMDCDSDRQDHCHTEELTLLSAKADKDSDTTTLLVKEKLKYRHLVETMTGKRGEDMDIRAEVGLLTRNIRVIGSQHVDGTQHFGAQLMMLKIDKVALEYVEFTHVGQAHQLGRYPVHFHHSGTLKDRAHVRGCAIHRTFNRAVTNHGTHHLLVENNVAYNVQGMAYFFEDAVEKGAIYRNNLGMMVRQSFSLLQKDMTPAVFWVTNPDNHLTNNRAAGCHFFGFWYDIHGGPRGLSAGMQGYHPSSTPLGTFLNNTAHSCGARGLWITNYDPAENGLRVPAVFEGMKTWGNAEGVEVLEVGHIQLKRHVSISDSLAAVATAVYFADGWGSSDNKWNAPMVSDVTVKSKSSLPRGMWTKCGIHGPTNDYITVKGLHVHDRFGKGFFCGCKWCPGPAGGLEVRFLETTFLSSDARTIKRGWRNAFDSYLHDADGTVSGEGRCHLHGCQIHPPMKGGTGHFPPEHCKLSSVGVVCSANTALRTMRIRDAKPATTKFKSLTITTPYGSSSSGFYFYDFRRGRQAGGLYHYTMVAGVSHTVTWNMGMKETDVDGFGGEICGLRKDEYFIWGTKTLANPVTFNFNGKRTSLEDMALMGCPEKCATAKCMYYLDTRGACTTRHHQSHTFCGGCRVEPNENANHRLIKMGFECKSRDYPLGEYVSATKCAAKCAKTKGCKYFVFGHGTKKGRCYHETTTEDKCPEGFEADMYDFYAVREPKGGQNDTMAGVDFEALNKQEGSNGLWQYSDAIESFDVDKWRAGSFNGLMNAKISGFKGGRWGEFRGTDDLPVSTWGSTPLQPCMGVSFSRVEGTASVCADEKDHERFGMDVPPRELSWCSDEWDTEEVRKYTMKTMWEKNDTIVIPGTWKVKFNCKELIKVKVLEIHGEVIFEDGADRSLQATHIYISYMGALRIGTAEKPFENNVLLALEGHRRTPAWPANELGSKFIVSMGKLDLYGQVKPTWSKLAKSVEKGVDTVETQKDLLLKEGDEVVVTTTDTSYHNVELHTVKSVAGTKVTLTQGLKAAHDGFDATHDGFEGTKGLLAGEVAVLRGNIRIEGLEGKAFQDRLALKDEAWGVNIQVFTINQGCDQPAEIHMQGVEVVNCGKDNSHCVHVGSAKGFIKNSVVRNGLGNGFMGGFGGMSIEGVLVTENVVYNIPKGHGISASGKATFNLVTKCGYGYKDVGGLNDFTDNVAAGVGGYTEFKKQADVCAFVSAVAPGEWKAHRNMFRGCGNGIIVTGGKGGKGKVCQRTIPSPKAYLQTSGCAAVEDLVIAHCRLMGSHSYGGSLIYDNMTFINTHKAVSHAGISASAHTTNEAVLTVRNSNIYAKKGRCGGFGIAAGTWYEDWLRIHRPLLAVTLYGGTVVKDVTFYGFGDCVPALANDVIGGWSVALNDGAHFSMFTQGLKFVGGSKTNLVMMAESGGACVQMKCDGRRSSIMVDTDGTLIGKPGTVVARNEQAWDYKLLPHSMRFYANGGAIPQDKLYSGKGAYRKGCTLAEKWNAWVCPEAEHRILILESLDHDWLERRYAPVAVGVNDKNEPWGGHISMYTGPGDGDNTKMIQAFWTMAHLGMRHNIYFASTNPIHTRVHLRDATPDQGCVISIYYGLPNRVEVFIGNKRAHALSEPTWDTPGMPKLDPSMPHGVNVYDRIGRHGKNEVDKRPGFLHFVVKGPQPLDLIVSKKIKLTQKLEVGEQEFVYKKGSQGLVRNLALLLNIPESRIKVVGLGSMKDGEIWGKHNGVENGYKPPSLLSSGNSSAELMQVVIDPHESENEDEIDGSEDELKYVFNQAKQTCSKGDIKCLKPPEIDTIPVAGWSCDASKYNTGDGCDCDCGIWDPDCDEDTKWGYGVLEEKDKIKLLDTKRVEALLKKFDNAPRDHELETAELFKINETLMAGDPLRKLAHEIQEAGKAYVPLLKLASSDTCGKGKKCMMNPKAALTPKALPSGVCTQEPEAKKGSACDANPCGECLKSQCVPSSSNSYGYRCLPTFTKTAIMNKETGKFLMWKHHCIGRRRRKRCFWKLEQADQQVGLGKFVYAGRGFYRDVQPFTSIKVSKSPEDCMVKAREHGAKAFGWKKRMWRGQQECRLYKEIQTGHHRRTHLKHYNFYEIAGKYQVFNLKANDASKFQIVNPHGDCLSSVSVMSEKCKEGESAKLQFFEVSQTCSEVGTIEYGGDCLEVAKTDSEVKKGACIPHYAHQQMTLIPLE